MQSLNMNSPYEENKRGEETQYKTFRETYKIISFAMSIGMIYPNPKIAAQRLICIFVALLTIMPMSSMILLDMYKSWLTRDIINIIRHCTIVGPFFGIFLKILILFYKRNPAKQLIDEIDNDYATYNNLPLSSKTIVNSHLQNNLRYSEKYWAITVVCCVVSFPGISIVMNIYNTLFKDQPVKYMVHDVNKPFAPPEERFESPFFEVLFIYTSYCALFYIINFTGFDGFFGLTINHACLKMDLYCKAFKDAMKAKDKATIHNKLVDVIKEQNRMFQYVDLIQDTFNIWLGVVLVATMIQICNCMYHITEGAELDPRYIIFIMGTVVHIYLPCRYSSKLKHMLTLFLSDQLMYILECAAISTVIIRLVMGRDHSVVPMFFDIQSMETSTQLYCGGWERVYDVSTRRTVLIMIARGQIPLEITAFNLLVFDMELFVSILKTSYSMYTLLRS